MPTVTVRLYALRLVQDVTAQLLQAEVWYEVTPIRTYYGAAYEVGVREGDVAVLANSFYTVTGRVLPEMLTLAPAPQPQPPLAPAPSVPTFQYQQPAPLPAPDTRVLFPHPTYRQRGPRHC